MGLARYNAASLSEAEVMEIDELKRQVGDRAAELVQDCMVVGLGSGSTARYATLRIGARLREGSLRNILGVPTSDDTEALARELGIPLTDLDAQPQVDLTIDGADEVDPALNVIKGLGGFCSAKRSWPIAPAADHRGGSSQAIAATGHRQPHSGGGDPLWLAAHQPSRGAHRRKARVAPAQRPALSHR